MAVAFTPNIGLAKPDGAELAENWVEGTQLQDDNNGIIQNETNIAYNAYTPVLIAATTAPFVGFGSSRGEWQDLGNGIIQGQFNIEFLDPGIGGGSGEFGISLPFPVDGTFHFAAPAINSVPGQYSVIGEGFYYDASNVDVSGHLALDVATIAGVSYLRMLTEIFTVPAKTNRFVSSAMPTPIVTGDAWTGNFIYKRV